MLFKVGKIVVLLIFYCNISCNKATKPNNKLANNLPIQQPKVKHTTTVDSIALEFSKKTAKIPIEGALQSKKPGLSDKLKTYTIDGDWLLTQFHNNHIEIDEYKTPVLGVDTLIRRIYGRDGCNTIHGDLLLIGNGQIKIGTIGGSKRACRNLADAEKFRESLKAARTYSLKRSKLYLFDKDEELLLEFERIIWE